MSEPERNASRSCSFLGWLVKPAPRILEGPLDAAPQVPEGPGAEPLSLLRPLLQPAGLGTVSLARREARGMNDEPQQHEIGIDLPGEHRFEVELEKRLTRERLAVTQDAQAQAVRHDRPEVCWAAVEELLNQAVGIGRGRAPLPCRAAIEGEAAADEMDRHGTEEAADRIGTASEFGASGHRQEAEPQFPQQGQAPLVVGESGPRHTGGQVFRTIPELPPVLAQAVPGLGDDLVLTLPGRQAVVVRRGARQLRLGVAHTQQQIQRQQPALGADRLEVLLVPPRHAQFSFGNRT